MELTVHDCGTIYIGYECSRVLQWTEDPINIISSTNTTPIVLTTDGTHTFVVNDKVEVTNHLLNIAANGNGHTVSVKTHNTLTLSGVASSGVAGVRSGQVAKCIDGTSYDLPTGVFCDVLSSSAAAILTPTLAWVTRNIFRYSLDLTDTQTTALAAYAGQDLFFRVKTKLGTTDIPIFLGKFTVKRIGG